LSTYTHPLPAYTPKMDPETKPDAQPVEVQEQTKRERPASPAAAEPNEEDAMNDSNPTKKPKFEKKSKKDYKPKSPYPGRGKNYADRPQLSEEERKAKAEERERLRVERRIADEERLENREEGDRRLPKRRCALLMGWVISHTSFEIETDDQILWIWIFRYADVSALQGGVANDPAKTTSIQSKGRCSRL